VGGCISCIESRALFSTRSLPLSKLKTSQFHDVNPERKIKEIVRKHENMHSPTEIGSSTSSTLTTFLSNTLPFCVAALLLIPLTSPSSSSKTTPGESTIRRPRSS
jgi:hypothetical protein